jgi:hypothetical protein
MRFRASAMKNKSQAEARSDPRCKKPFVVAASCCRIASQFPNVLAQCANLQPHCESKMLRISDDGEV